VLCRLHQLSRVGKLRARWGLLKFRVARKSAHNQRRAATERLLVCNRSSGQEIRFHLFGWRRDAASDQLENSSRVLTKK
jgi:hypothetical protein